MGQVQIIVENSAVSPANLDHRKKSFSCHVNSVADDIHNDSKSIAAICTMRHGGNKSSPT